MTFARSWFPSLVARGTAIVGKRLVLDRIGQGSVGAAVGIVAGMAAVRAGGDPFMAQLELLRGDVMTPGTKIALPARLHDPTGIDEMRIVTGGALALPGRRMSHTLVPVGIDLVTVQAQLRQTLQKIRAPVVAVRGMTDRAVAMRAGRQLPGFLVVMTVDAKRSDALRQQRRFFTGVGTMTRSAKPVFERLMTAFLLPQGFLFLVALAARRRALGRQQLWLRRTVGVMTSGALPIGKGPVNTELPHVPVHLLMTLGAEFLLLLDQNTGHRTFMVTVAGQALPLLCRRMVDRPRLDRSGMAVEAQGFGRGAQQLFLSGCSQVRLMAAETSPFGGRGVGTPLAGLRGTGAEIGEPVAGKTERLGWLAGHPPVIADVRRMTLLTLPFHHRPMDARPGKGTLLTGMAPVTQRGARCAPGKRRGSRRRLMTLLAGGLRHRLMHHGP